MLALDLFPILYSMYRKRRKAKRREEEENSISREINQISVKINVRGFLEEIPSKLSLLTTFKNKPLLPPFLACITKLVWSSPQMVNL